MARRTRTQRAVTSGAPTRKPTVSQRPVYNRTTGELVGHLPKGGAATVGTRRKPATQAVSIGRKPTRRKHR